MKLSTISRPALANALAFICVAPEGDDPNSVVVTSAQIADVLFQHAESRVDLEDGRVYPPYSEMIRRLFKTMPQVPHASALHAALGLSGEAAELLAADSYKNLIEEGGDLEFYFEALLQQLNIDIKKLRPINAHLDSRCHNLTLSSIPLNIVTLTGDILDAVKKSWVYGKGLDTARIEEYITLLGCNLNALYALVGTNPEHVRHVNQVKLIGPNGRFASGFYSDEAAINRDDKKVEPGADRQFFGKNT